MYPIWPASTEPEKNAWEAVSEPMEMAPKAVERTNTASEALFGVCVRYEARLSQACPGRALSRLQAKKMREAETNYRKGYLLVYGILRCVIGDDSQTQPRTPSDKQS